MIVLVLIKISMDHNISILFVYNSISVHQSSIIFWPAKPFCIKNKTENYFIYQEYCQTKSLFVTVSVVVTTLP